MAHVINIRQGEDGKFEWDWTHEDGTQGITGAMKFDSVDEAMMFIFDQGGVPHEGNIAYLHPYVPPMLLMGEDGEPVEDEPGAPAEADSGSVRPE